jgi:hypothetical protein
MKIQGVNITGGIRLDPPAAPTPSGPSKFVVGARELGYPAKYGGIYVYNTDGTGEVKITASDGADNDRFGWSVAMSDTKVVAGAVFDDDAGSSSGSVYVYNTDGTGELKIVASDAANGDQFGISVAMSDTHIVVGAYADDYAAGINSGSVYVYNTDGTGELKIVASDGGAGDLFGCSVAMSDTHIVVGAESDDDAGGNSGSVYVYNLDGTGEVKITASDAAASDGFGSRVAMSDTHIVVGVQGNDDAGSLSGSAYIYNLDGTGEVKITASDAAADDRFGCSVAVSDTKVAVGARNHDNVTGAVYVYNTDGTGEVKITASDGASGDRFGCSVAIQGDKIIVGADSENSNQGAAYIYNTDGTGEQKILASDGASQERFGGAVAIN